LSGFYRKVSGFWRQLTPNLPSETTKDVHHEKGERQQSGTQENLFYPGMRHLYRLSEFFSVDLLRGQSDPGG